MLAIEIFPLDDVALVLAPASGAVAVVDARARAIVAGLSEGRGDDELACQRTGSDALAATAQVAALRHAWTALAQPSHRRRCITESAPRPAPPALDVLCRAASTPVRLQVWPPRLARLLRAVTAALPRGVDR